MAGTTLGGTRDERDIQADKDLAIQLKIEKSSSRELTGIFKTIGRDHRAVYASTGTILNAEAYRDQISGSLMRSYQRANNEVTGRITRFIRKNPKSELSQAMGLLAEFNNLSIREQLEAIQDDSRVETIKFIKDEVESATQQIIKTTNKQLNTIVDKVQTEAFENGIRLTSRETAKQSTADFNRAIPGRVSNIAATEVGNAIEGIKQLEAISFVSHAQTLQITGQAKTLVVKEWITRGDEKTRPAHVIADSQQRRVEEAYSVDGEALMRPLDRSLGASSSNTNRCRCKSIITVHVDINQISV